MFNLNDQFIFLDANYRIPEFRKINTWDSKGRYDPTFATNNPGLDPAGSWDATVRLNSFFLIYLVCGNEFHVQERWEKW